MEEKDLGGERKRVRKDQSVFRPWTGPVKVLSCLGRRHIVKEPGLLFARQAGQDRHHQTMDLGNGQDVFESAVRLRLWRKTWAMKTWNMCLAYNLFLLFRRAILPDTFVRAQIQTIRWQVYQVAGKVVRHAGALLLKVAEDVLSLFQSLREKTIA